MAERRLPKETGGILLGYRVRNGVHVVASIEVPDARATRHGYVLRAADAQELLNEARSHFPAGSPVGFVGDWHVHPAVVAPSPTDRSSLRRVSRFYPKPIVQLVVASTASGGWQAHGLMSSRVRIRRTEIVFNAHLGID